MVKIDKNNIRKIVYIVGFSVLVSGIHVVNYTNKKIDEIETRLTEEIEEDIKEELKKQIEEELEKSIEEKLKKRIDEEIKPRLEDEIVEMIESKLKEKKKEELKKESSKKVRMLQEETGKYGSEFTKMCMNLRKVLKKLDITLEEYIKYENNGVPCIGTPVNLVSDKTPIYSDIYSLNNRENKKTSYFGTSEARYIQAIILSKGDKVIEVYNMHDYEELISRDFKVVGYNLVNQYSIDDGEKLTTEFRCDEDGIKLIYGKNNS